MQWILPLETAAADYGAVGEKGANLGLLIEAGLPVPDGFVLTSAAYHAFVQDAGLLPLIEGAAAALDPDRPETVEQASSAITRAFRSAAIPPSVIDALREAYAALDVPVAVRSSFVEPQEKGQPFVGLGETVLNVLGLDALLEAVRACWSSLWLPQALVHRGPGFPPAQASMAVIVQRMFRADVSGIIMTVNAETANPDEMVIRAARGVGTAVLSGQVIPQEIVFNRYHRSVTRQSMPGALVIMPDQALELARLGERIEYHFGCPQTVEWAWDEDTFCILQAYPIQVHVPPRIRWEPPSAGMTYTRRGLVELLPAPVSTLFETVGLPAFEQGILSYSTHLGEPDAVTTGALETINGYVYQRENARGGLSHLLALPRLRSSGEHALAHWEQEARPAYQQEVAALTGEPGALESRELANRIVGLAQAAGRYWAVVSEMMVPIDQAETHFHTTFARLRKQGDPNPHVFLQGLETEMLQAHRAILSRNAISPGPSDCALFTLDFAHPTGGEDLSAWQWVSAEGRSEYLERTLRLYGERVTAEEQMQSRLSGWQRRLLGSALNDAQRAVKAREDALFELGLAWAPLRGCARELGRRLTAAGALHAPEQVYWLRRSELFVLAAALDAGKAQVASHVARVESRQAAASAMKNHPAPLVVPAGEESRSGEQAVVITGRGISPGAVTGVARRVRGPEDFQRLQPGDIVVAAAIPPAWVPLFHRAAGAVLEFGGPVSLSSRAPFLAGLPMVVEVGAALEHIPDGAVITVDGDSGIVTVEANASKRSE